jgi:sodium/potassium-transporting ATPase subunit alpha
LAFATLDLPIESYPEDYPFDPNAEEKNFPMDNLNFIGIMSLNDPPRVGVERSVLQCKEAGIKVIMVTGDQPVTAKAIAIKVDFKFDNYLSNLI